MVVQRSRLMPVPCIAALQGMSLEFCFWCRGGNPHGLLRLSSACSLPFIELCLSQACLQGFPSGAPKQAADPHRLLGLWAVLGWGSCCLSALAVYSSLFCQKPDPSAAKPLAMRRIPRDDVISVLVAPPCPAYIEQT